MDYRKNRSFLKSDFEPNQLKDTDQANGVAMPPWEKSFDKEKLIVLPDPRSARLENRDIVDIIAARKSRRKLGEADVSLEQLSFVLWATQGKRDAVGGRIFRNVPSAGSRHPFESYIYADKVEGLEKGLYRYIATENALLPIKTDENGETKEALNKALLRQMFNCGFAVVWAFNPYRCEWRYVNHSYKVSALDAGHIAQNGYLAAEALGLGCCAIGAYSQKELDQILGLDGEEEFASYIGVFGAYKVR